MECDSKKISTKIHHNFHFFVIREYFQAMTVHVFIPIFAIKFLFVCVSGYKFAFLRFSLFFSIFLPFLGTIFQKPLSMQKLKSEDNEITKNSFEILVKSKNTRARISKLKLQLRSVTLPIFMPVATHGVLKASHFRVRDIVLGNTFHLRNLNKDLKEYMGIDACLTDSGGFQIISLKNEVSEDGVFFLDYTDSGNLISDFQNNCTENSTDKEQAKKEDNFDTFCRNSYCFTEFCQGCVFEESQRAEYLKKYKNFKYSGLSYLLTPEKSISIQNKLNSDIAMQLDDVIRPDSSKLRHLVAVKRSVRWLDRLLVANKNNKQYIFPIIQGGLHEDLRNFSVDEILARASENKSIKGIAIGGLCGGEDKKAFCDVVFQTSQDIRQRFDGPIYVMGVGYPEDVLISICLGSDMSDCVYPTRTARFGRMFTDYGDININGYNFEKNKNPNIIKQDIDNSFNNCECRTCQNFSLEYIRHLKKTENFCILITEHNLFYMQNLTDRIKKAIKSDTLIDFLQEWVVRRYGNTKPEWIDHVFSLLSSK